MRYVHFSPCARKIRCKITKNIRNTQIIYKQSIIFNNILTFGIVVVISFENRF